MLSPSCGAPPRPIQRLLHGLTVSVSRTSFSQLSRSSKSKWASSGSNTGGIMRRQRCCEHGWTAMFSRHSTVGSCLSIPPSRCDVLVLTCQTADGDAMITVFRAGHCAIQQCKAVPVFLIFRHWTVAWTGGKGNATQSSNLRRHFGGFGSFAPEPSRGAGRLGPEFSETEHKSEYQVLTRCARRQWHPSTRPANWCSFLQRLQRKTCRHSANSKAATVPPTGLCFENKYRHLVAGVVCIRRWRSSS